MMALAAGLLLVPVLDQAVKLVVLRVLAPASLSLGPLGKLEAVPSRIWYAGPDPIKRWSIWFLASASLAAFTGFFPLSGWFVGALLGGSLSHALETSLRGYVIDYVRLRFWPAFNLADVAITAGAAGVLVQIVLTTTEAWARL
jgi:lipoprotein signal peptidase